MWKEILILHEFYLNRHLIKASPMKVSNITKLSVVLRSDLKPDWNRDI